jgi:hypothetical protein
MLIVKDTTCKFYHGHKSVGTSPTKIIVPGYKFIKGIVLRAPGDNDPVSNNAPIWIGRADVTANSNEAAGGMPIAPGESLTLPLESGKDLYAISNTANQDIAWIGL